MEPGITTVYAVVSICIELHIKLFAYGLDPAVKARAELLWSLSKLTFTHEIARFLLFEQLFRASSILRGGSYHNP